MNELQELKKQLQEQQDKITYLQAEIERLEKIEQGNQWKPSLGEVYWVVSDGGQILLDCWDDYQTDNDRLSIGNVYATEEEAEFEAERLKVINELKKYSREFVVDDYNYEFYFSHIEQKIVYDCSKIYKTPSLYFPSEEIARQAIEAVGKDRVIKYYLGVEY